MKKHFFIFSPFIFSFLLSKAQDTLVYNTGQKLSIQVYSIEGNKIEYQDQYGQKNTVAIADVAYIKYADGSKYTPDHPAGISSIEDMIDINAGIGASFITWALPNANAFSLGGDNFYTILFTSPACNLTADYNITNSFSMGLGGAYQEIIDNPDFGGHAENWERERISRYNISFRMVGHLSKNTVSYAYLGARFGVSIWTDNVIYYNPTSPFQYPSTSMPHSSERVSAQLFFGYRKYISNAVGVHFELGIGSPYLIEAGISVRFKA